MAELNRLFRYFDGNARLTLPMSRVVQFAVATAMRLDEICRVKWRGLKVDRRMLLIRDRKGPRNKTGNDQRIRKVSDLVGSLNEPGTREEAADLLRGLIEKIVLRPDADAPNGHEIELYGELGAILSLCSKPGATNANARRRRKRLIRRQFRVTYNRIGCGGRQPP